MRPQPGDKVQVTFEGVVVDSSGIGEHAVLRVDVDESGWWAVVPPSTAKQVEND